MPEFIKVAINDDKINYREVDNFREDYFKILSEFYCSV